MTTNYEQHPSYGLIGVNRISGGRSLFDSDIKHNEYMTVRLFTARRSRDLNHDWIGADQCQIEVHMSFAQWAAFVSSVGRGDGVPCTIDFNHGPVEQVQHEPRLAESLREVKEAATKAMADVETAYVALLDAVEAKKGVSNAVRHLGHIIRNQPANMKFAADTLTKHAENVVTKAKADIEALVSRQYAIERIESAAQPAREVTGPAIFDVPS